MKKILNIAMLALLTLAMAACGKEAIFGPETEEGQLSIRRMMLEIENESTVVRAGIDISKFMVDIYKVESQAGNVKYKSYVYHEMPEVVTLPVGDYLVKVRSGEVEVAAWDVPYYEGEQPFTINSKEITEVETVKCKLANVRVSVIFTDELKAKMSDDAKVTVLLAGNVSLEFTKDETRSGYFQYVEGNNTLVATFSGTVDGSEVPELFNTQVDVAPGTHYKLTYKYHDASTPNGDGSIDGQGVHVRSDVEDVTREENVEPDIDRPTDDERPTEGTDDPDEPDTPDHPDPSTGGPVIVPADEPGNVTLDGVNDGNSITMAKINIHSDSGITKFVVTISSDNDGFMAAVSDMLPTQFDLTNLDDTTAANLASLGLPVGDEVKGQHDVPFNITEFIPILSAFSGQHCFSMAVTDASGTTKKDLIIKY